MPKPNNILKKFSRPQKNNLRLLTYQEYVPDATNPDISSFSVIFTIRDKYREYSHRVFGDELAVLYDRYRFISSDSPKDLQQAHQFLTEHLDDRSKRLVAELLHNLITSNPIPVIEDFYDELSTYSSRSKMEILSSDEIAEMDLFLAANSRFVLMYMRQLSQLSNQPVKGTDPVVIFRSHNSSSESIGRGDGDNRWTDTTMTITYCPFTNELKASTEPWRISIETKISDYKNWKYQAINSPRQQRKLFIQLMNDEFESLISTIQSAENCFHTQSN